MIKLAQKFGEGFHVELSGDRNLYSISIYSTTGRYYVDNGRYYEHINSTIFNIYDLDTKALNKLFPAESIYETHSKIVEYFFNIIVEYENRPEEWLTEKAINEMVTAKGSVYISGEGVLKGPFEKIAPIMEDGVSTISIFLQDGDGWDGIKYRIELFKELDNL